MISKRKTTGGIAAVAQALLAAAALFAVATPAVAAGIGSGLGANYTFPDGSPGFALNLSTSDGSNTLTSDGLLLPAVLVEFNPQPDPPGKPLPTFLSLTDPTKPTFTNTSTGPYTFVMSFLNLLPGGCDPKTISAPNSDGVGAGLSCSGALGTDPDVAIDVTLTFEGPAGITSWGAFNPQPDPPGDVAGFDLTFPADASLIVQISADNIPLDFALPEPGTLSLFGTALIGLAAWRRRRRRS